MDTQKDWVDFRAVKQAVSMQALLDHYGINWLRKNNDELRGRCPIHKGDGDRNFHVNLVKNVFNCFSCKARGNVLDFVAAMENCSVRDAGLKLKDRFQVGESVEAADAPVVKEVTPPETLKKSDAPVIINPSLSFELRADINHEYGLSRGLLPETLRAFGAGFCLSKGIFAGRFIIPLHNGAGELVGYAGRSLDDNEPKYLFPSNEKGFYKSHLLFNLHRVIGSACVVVVEGFFAAMRLYQLNLASVGLLGSSLSAQQENMLAQFPHIFLLCDGDSAGRACTDECLVKLGRRGVWIKAVMLPDNLQPDHLSDDELLRLIPRCPT
jgi:DNA primase